jgi:hypothetical protein
MALDFITKQLPYTSAKHEQETLVEVGLAARFLRWTNEKWM